MREREKPTRSGNRVTRRTALTTGLAATAATTLLGSGTAHAMTLSFPASVTLPYLGGNVQFDDGTRLIIPTGSVLAERTVFFDKWLPADARLWDGATLATEVLIMEPDDGGPVLDAAEPGAPVVVVLPKLPVPELVRGTVTAALSLRQNTSFPDPDSCTPQPKRRVYPFGRDAVMYHLDALATSTVVHAAGVGP